MSSRTGTFWHKVELLLFASNEISSTTSSFFIFQDGIPQKTAFLLFLGMIITINDV